MRAAITMWKYPRMLGLVVICAAMYGAALGPLKAALPLVPGVTEVRLASILPMPMGMLFGPAGAWGAAFGNLAGDLFGTLSLASVFGFFGNFLLGYLPYALLRHFPHSRTDVTVRLHTATEWSEYLMIGILGATAAATFIAWGADLTGVVPFPVLSTIIAINDTVGNWLGGLLVLVLAVPLRRLGLVWTGILDSADLGQPRRASLGAVLIILGAFGGWYVGAFLLPGNLIVTGAFWLAIVIGALLL